MREHQLARISQRQPWFDREDRMQRDLSSPHVRAGPDAGTQQVEIRDDAPNELLAGECEIPITAMQWTRCAAISRATSVSILRHRS